MNETELKKEIERDIDNCDICSVSQYKLELFGGYIFCCKFHFEKWSNYLKGYQEGKAETMEKVMEEIEHINLELLFTDIRDKKGIQIPESQDLMELFNVFWLYIQNRLKKNLEQLNKQGGQNG